jgi:8-oxo-dGTP pyrophosphatase MutT (NUDIX family)
MEILKREVLVRTGFCDFVAKTLDEPGSALPYYAVRQADYVSIVASTTDSQLLLVRQYRPAVETFTYELPAGCVDSGESPETCARRELLEETGYEAGRWEELGCMIPDSGRLCNRLYTFYAKDLARSAAPFRGEAGVELVYCPLSDVVNWVLDGRLSHALHVASLFLAVLRGKLQVN